MATLFAAWLILVQAVLGVPLSQRLMAPEMLLADGSYAICTAGGPADTDHHAPAGDQQPSCPFCLPLCGGAATISMAAILSPPATVAVLRREPPAAQPLRVASAVRAAQPRGPPASI